MGKKASILIVIGLLLFSPSLSAQTWSPSFRLTWNPGKSNIPVVAIDSDDSIHVVWYDDSPGNSEIFYRNSSDGGASWSAIKRLSWSSSSSSMPTIDIDQNNDIHVIWADSASGNYELYHKKSTDGGSSWPASKRLTWTPKSTFRPQIGIDSSNTIHIICLDSPSSVDDVMYKKSKDGGASWTSLKRLTWTSVETSMPAFVVAPDDSLHVVWRDSAPGNREIYYKNSTNGGTSWNGSKRLTWTSTTSSAPDITVDLNDKIHVVWQDYSLGYYELFYRSSTDGGITWAVTRRLTWHPRFSEYPNITVASDNIIHLAWYNFVSSTNPEIFYKSSTDGGITWGATQRLTWNSSWSAYPKMATDSSSNVHMVWLESISNNYEIFYRNRK